MIRTDIITTVGRKYLTSNIENEEFSYGKALKAIGKDYTNFLSEDARRVYKDLDIRFSNDKLSILIETKQNLYGNFLEKSGIFIFVNLVLSISSPFSFVNFCVSGSKVHVSLTPFKLTWRWILIFGLPIIKQSSCSNFS